MKRRTPEQSLLVGYMISFATWEKFIRLSSGSEAMKDRLINYVVDRFGRELIDSFKLGLSYGELANTFTSDELDDLFDTIKLTRDTDNVPIVAFPKAYTLKFKPPE